jgi:hypothetical protein
MLVRDQNAIQALRIFSNEAEAPYDLFRAQPCVDKHTSISCNDQDRITSRSAAENGKFHVWDSGN